MSVILNLTCKLKLNLSHLILKCDEKLLWTWMACVCFFYSAPFHCSNYVGHILERLKGKVLWQGISSQQIKNSLSPDIKWWADIWPNPKHPNISKCSHSWFKLISNSESTNKRNIWSSVTELWKYPNACVLVIIFCFPRWLKIEQKIFKLDFR